MYRRLGDAPRFQPCGQKESFAIFGNPDGLSQLRDANRWNSVWQGTAMFGIFAGIIVTDTLKPKGPNADSTAVTVRTRFFVTGVDTLRTWKNGDCGGMRVR